ncbi:SirB2 family protein [Leeia sp. TBRC 13508]|uniref:SirB2 family protein n=1 Tax=Leeia speluncae TaxID=2884804 RepID=A0ABS8D8M0_9NEIS|nr:SirB2 family protein [Leeia speluncae]MCB6184363.1 SirB2 family protein [Leeia speluncae]
MQTYIVLKHIHMLAVVLSGAFFLKRGHWMLNADDRLEAKWVKVLPHVIDTILLGSAIGLVVVGKWYENWPAWLSAKIVLVVLYVLFGTFALKRGKTLQIRLIMWVLAIAVFITIALTAISKAFPPSMLNM